MSEGTINGFVSIYRDIMDNWVWKDKPFSKGQAWVDLILLANYKQEKFLYKGQVVEAKRGTVYRSIRWLAERWGWSRDKTRRFLELLQIDQMITVQATKHNTTITLINYETFQNKATTNNSINRPQTGHISTTDRPQTDIYNKENKDNKVNMKNNFIISNVDDADIQTPEEIAEAQQWFDSLGGGI